MDFFLFKKILKAYLSPILQKNINQKFTLPKNLEKGVFIFGITDFDYRFQRWQHLSFGLSKKIPVFYINPSFIIQKKIKSSENFYIKKIHKKNLYEINLTSDLDYFIYQMEPTNKGKNIIANSVKEILMKTKIKKYIFIITHPFWYFLTDFFNKEKIIYDCLDDHSGFKENRKDINQIEKKLVKNINYVIVTSNVLKEKILNYDFNKNIFLIENGVEKKLIQDKKNIQSKKNIKTFGYIGEINWWFDDDFLTKILNFSKKIEIVLIGKINNEKIYQLSKKYFNLKLIGEVNYKKIRFWLKKFDVGLIPFKKNSFTDSINPVKLYEYFAFGLPVIASDLENLKRFENLIYFYFENNINQILKNIRNENIEKKFKRLELANKNTWDKRISDYFDIIKSII